MHEIRLPPCMQSGYQHACSQVTTMNAIRLPPCMQSGYQRASSQVTTMNAIRLPPCMQSAQKSGNLSAMFSTHQLLRQFRRCMDNMGYLSIHMFSMRFALITRVIFLYIFSLQGVYWLQGSPLYTYVRYEVCIDNMGHLSKHMFSMRCLPITWGTFLCLCSL